MKPKLHIDGTEEFGYSCFNRFLYSFYMYMNTVKRITDLYRFASVQDLKGYVAHYCYLRLKSFDTFLKVLVEHKDYVSANCLLRMLGDNVAIFRLIYGEKDKDLLLLRHALYVIDGCERNLEVLPEKNVNEGCLPEEELKKSIEATRYTREHRQRLMREAQEILDASSLQHRDKAAFDKIVEERNWKFKEFKEYKKKGSNHYKWQELYELIDKEQQEIKDYYNYLREKADREAEEKRKRKEHNEEILRKWQEKLDRENMPDAYMDLASQKLLDDDN